LVYFRAGCLDGAQPRFDLYKLAGAIAIQHQVETAEPTESGFASFRRIPAFTNGAWAIAVQSRIEGISVLPIR
jgi:hypothetical protein